jgi:hypothetical protein
MIQLIKAQDINTVAFYPEVPVSASITDIKIIYSQDINLNTGSFDGVIDSKLNWIVASISGSVIPGPSGQYTLNIYELIPGAALVWNTAEDTWNSLDVQWNVGTSEVLGALIATERAYISGSNESSLTTYLSPGQAGYYITYQD